MSKSRTGLLIIRAWVGPGSSSSPHRAELRLTTDVPEEMERSLVVAQEEAVVEAVQAWLSEMLAGSPTLDDDPNSL